MESKAHYAFIGAFVLIVFVGALCFIAWLSNAQFDQQYDEYEVVFNGPVRGLSQGSEVRFSGLRVGEVTKLNLDPKDSSAVIAHIEVGPETPVHTNSYAQLEPLGLTGLSYIQIFSGGEEFPLLKELPGRGPYRIPGRMSQIDNFIDSGGSLIEGAQAALGRVNVTFSPEAIEDFHGILRNINQITYNLRETSIDPDLIETVLKTFAEAAEGVTAAAAAVDIAAEEFDVLVKDDIRKLLLRSQESMEALDKALGSIDGAAIGSQGLITDARDAINRLSNSGLTDVEETLDGIRRVVDSLSRIADELERNPVQFVAGKDRQTVELPQ